MADETIKLKPGEELIITVGKKHPGGKRRGLRHKRRGPIGDPDIRDKYLPRRLRKGGINFYDMGQLTDGEGGWADTYTAQSDVNFDSVTGPSRFVLLSDTEARDAVLLAVEEAEMKASYRKVTKGDVSLRYGIQVYPFGLLNDLDEWKATGLQLTQEQLDAGIYIGSNLDQYWYFDTVTLALGDTNVKITGERSYAADAVPFTPSPAMDIFLAPKFVQVFGTSGGGDIQRYGHVLLQMPRRFGINTDDPFYIPSELTPPSVEGAAAIANWKSVVPGNDYHFDDGTDTWSLGGPAFPIDPAYQMVPSGLEFDIEPFAVNGKLLAAILKGSSWFYFWTDNR